MKSFPFFGFRWCFALLALLAFAVPLSAQIQKSWTFADGAAGWRAEGQTSAEVKEQELRVTGANHDPIILSRFEAPAGDYTLKVWAKPAEGQASPQVFWATTDHGFGEDNSDRLSLEGVEDGWQLYTGEVRASAPFTRLRYDPDNRAGLVRIKKIELVKGIEKKVESFPEPDLKLLPGFKAEMIYSVPGDDQGSWVSMTLDPKGRIITSDQYGGLYRVTVPEPGEPGEATVEKIPVKLGMAQGLLHAFGSLYVVVNGNDEMPSGLYRVTDTDNDDTYDKVEMLRRLEGGGEHGPHAVILGPEGKQLYIIAGNHTKAPEPLEESVVPRVWEEDQLLPRLWDANGHARGILAPAGWIARTDPDGKSWELVSMGFRNPYDIAFNRAGELFTYDADMEWDIGTPWYRPTRVNHVVSGSDFGWRSGTGKWPEYYADSLPAVVDIGPGSPTGIAFGYGSGFPKKYREALFICDWSYGKMYAVHMERDGASYTGELELFISATPLALTDLVINPEDGAMYFTTGGRRVRSALYRVTYEGEVEKSEEEERGLITRKTLLRRTLEELHGKQTSKAIEYAWPYLADEDRFVRHAARVAIEHQPLETWRGMALAEERPQAVIEAMIALARHGGDALQPKILAKLNDIDFAKLGEQGKLGLLRAYQLAFTRMGKPSAADQEAAIARLNPHFPASSYFLNRELSQLMIYLDAPGAAEKTIALLQKAPSQQEQLQYALWLSTLDSGWTRETSEAYFTWFKGARAFKGGNSFGGFVRNIRNQALENLTDAQKEALGEVLKEDEAPNPLANLPRAKGPGKAWTVDELTKLAETELKGRDFENGRAMYGATLCSQCHRFDGSGGNIGPDLTGVGARFSNRDLIEAIIEPNKEVSDQYAATTFHLKDGKTVSGRVVNLVDERYMVQANPFDPSVLTLINYRMIEKQEPSEVSVMPAGLIYSLNEEEALDLIAYLKSLGDPDAEYFKE